MWLVSFYWSVSAKKYSYILLLLKIRPNVFTLHQNYFVGFCDSGTGLKCYSCMFPDDSWCKDTANLKFQEEAKTQQICPEHVKQCGYSKIGKKVVIFLVNTNKLYCNIITIQVT